MQSLTTRRVFQGSMIAALAMLLSGAALGQTYPNRSIRLVVPYSAGAGVSDIMSRLVGQQLGAALGQLIVIDNRPGAGGNVGAEIVAKAAPDGYTLLMGSSFLAVNPYLYANMPYQPLTDLVPVTTVATNLLVLVVHPSVAAKSVAELIALAKAKPGQLNYGSGGIGSTPYLATELFKSLSGIDIAHVSYKGGAPALADLAGGQLSMMIENMPGTMPFVNGGKLRALAITSRQRSPLTPDLPTMTESGVAGYEMIGWNGIFAPKGTPPDIVAKLNSELAKILRTPAMREQLAALGAEPGGETSDAFGTFVKSESARWGKIIQERGIKPE